LKEEEQKAYVDVDKSLEEKQRGNDLYQQGMIVSCDSNHMTFSRSKVNLVMPFSVTLKRSREIRKMLEYSVTEPLAITSWLNGI
jgi:hypothetical protein